jgi:hypothetical protein
MVKRMTVAGICLLLIVQAPARAAARVVLRVTPSYAQAPATVRIEVTVEPDEQNRALLIGLDSGEYYRSSSIALEGADAARFYTVHYSSVPAGAYQVQVEVQTTRGGARADAFATVQVMP